MPALWAGGIHETFSNVSEGALLTTLPNWTFNGDQDAWTVASGGKNGGMIEARTPGTYLRNLSGEEVFDATSGTYTFKAKICLVGSDAWEDVRLSLLQSGGVNGITLKFSSGADEGSSDNAVAISEGGEFWGDVKFKTSEVPWQANTWYQVEIKNLQWDGGVLSGNVSVYALDDPAQKLLDNQPVGLFGPPAAFKKIDLISIASVGAGRAFQISDLELGPETAGGATP